MLIGRRALNRGGGGRLLFACSKGLYYLTCSDFAVVGAKKDLK